MTLHFQIIGFKRQGLKSLLLGILVACVGWVSVWGCERCDVSCLQGSSAQQFIWITVLTHEHTSWPLSGRKQLPLASATSVDELWVEALPRWGRQIYQVSYTLPPIQIFVKVSQSWLSVWGLSVWGWTLWGTIQLYCHAHSLKLYECLHGGLLLHTCRLREIEQSKLKFDKNSQWMRKSTSKCKTCKKQDISCCHQGALCFWVMIFV